MIPIPFPPQNEDYGLEPDYSISVKVKGSIDEDSFLNCFEDVIRLLNEEEENSISRPFFMRGQSLESPAKFAENILAIVNECKLRRVD